MHAVCRRVSGGDELSDWLCVAERLLFAIAGVPLSGQISDAGSYGTPKYKLCKRNFACFVNRLNDIVMHSFLDKNTTIDALLCNT